MEKKIRIAQVAYDSEWALAKFFMAMFNGDGIQDRFELACVCGLPASKTDALKNLRSSLNDRILSLSRSPGGSAQKGNEIDSLLELIDKLQNQNINYYPVYDNLTLPEEVYQNCDAIIIHSINPSHLWYAEDAVKHDKHVICEKPVVPMLNSRGLADDTAITKLEELTAEAFRKGLVVMDAEHYSYKVPAIVFFENLADILDRQKIVAVEGAIKEFDDPGSLRTGTIINPRNQTGILGDTGVHLVSFISSLGGKIATTKAKYDLYQGYFVDTYDEVEFEIKNAVGNNFSSQSRGRFAVAKFIDRFEKTEEESKFIQLELEDGSKVRIDFREGKLFKTFPDGKVREYVSQWNLGRNEYVNILHHFYAKVINGQQPRTSFNNSITGLRALHEMYSFYDMPSAKDKNRVRVYR